MSKVTPLTRDRNSTVALVGEGRIVRGLRNPTTLAPARARGPGLLPHGRPRRTLVFALPTQNFPL